GESQCASCHMPKRAVADVVHTAYTDHRIQRPGSTLTLQGLQPWRGDSPRERGLAMFEVGEARGDVEMLQQAYRILVSQPARDAAVLAALGTLTLQKSRPVEAAQLFEQAVRQEPGNAEAWFRLGLAQQAAGKTDAAVDAFQAASKADPYFFQAYVAEATLRKSDKSEYRRILERYLRHVPQSLAARKALAAAR
ncbi:MAG TPA: tetratricopeptide repeat protein, partial [Bryobacteraceae bacterium]|nr:tetratricopeptide repeat protein [Bryobacteraceae bacterium]